MVPVTPGVLGWARNTRLLSPERAAELLEWPVERLHEIEATDSIDFADLEHIGNRYKLPTATLLMPEPLPADRYPPRALHDFRLHAHMDEEPLGLATQIRVENAFELIELLSDVNEADEELAPRPLLPAFELTDDAQRAASRERARLGTNLDEQLGWETDKEAFLHWREVIEAAEIIVHKVRLHEESVRGFALFKDGYALIACDSNDDYRARNFTLWHEYAHLLLRAGGISDQNRQNRTERWCNQFAANFLMPAERFKREYYDLFPAGGPPDDWQVARMATRFKTSKSSVAIRFEELGLASAGFYDRLKKGWKNRSPRAMKQLERDQIDIELGRFGTTHVTAIGTALERGVINSLEAKYALDVPTEHLTALTQAARERHRAYGPTR